MVSVNKTGNQRPINRLWLGTRPIITFQKAEYVEVITEF